MEGIVQAILEIEFAGEFVNCKKLNGYENANYLIEVHGVKYILKTYHEHQELEQLIQSESSVLSTLQKPHSSKYPKPILLQNGLYCNKIRDGEIDYLYRILSFLDGKFLGETEHSIELFHSLGHFIAQMNRKLNSYKNYFYQARKFEWDIQYVELNKPKVDAIKDVKDRSLVRYFLQQFDEKVRPYAHLLRKQIIHNDANEWNVLTTDNTVTGIIDFGDLTHSFLINELAITITYACYDKPDPIAWSQEIIKGYHEINPLLETELDLLYYLIAARLCISVCNAAHAQIANPDNNYLSVSEKPAWQMLKRWITINPLFAANAFRTAAGFKQRQMLSIDHVISRRNQYFSKVYTLSYSSPIHMIGAAFQYMYDAQGNTYLDAYNNIPHVGHNHPKVVEAGQKQMATLNTNTRYLYDHLSDYAEHLLTKFPSVLNTVYLVNSGSAASDLAVRLAKMHTKKNGIVVMELGYHGNTQIGIDISEYKFNNPIGHGQADHIITLEIPDAYKGKYSGETQGIGPKYAQDAIDSLLKENNNIAAFIAEPILGCAGQVPLAEGYLETLYPAIRKQGGICISDEVQTGFGRLGEYYWGFEMHNVIPDIVILGKPIANGHPMGAVICTDTIAASFEAGVEFFSSFGGNPVSCKIAQAVLEVIDEEALQEQAKHVGSYYKDQLQKLMTHYPCIGDVRGMGLFLGIELVEDGTTHPDPTLAKWIKNKMREKHILISTDGRHDNILKSKPPLCFTKENVDSVVSTLDQLFQQHYTNKLSVKHN